MTNKLYLTQDGVKREMNAEEKKQFETDQAEALLLESEAQAKRQARIDAITKLGQASGLTAEEIESILNI